ncbi:MAG: enoyl-CoA hydratase/isomerase family protein [Acidobacteriia bacterium]|nr:enoyl-CoA hydratase/isomerase family protein [Terriglobia bacterium]
MAAALEKLADGKILANVEDGIGLVTFNQPEKRNAMSVDMWAGLEQVFGAWEHDDSVRVVVLAGAGDKAFVSGADISEFEKRRANVDAGREYEHATSGGRAKLAAFPKPVIARIRGYCLGGGLAIAMQADLRIATEDSQFGIPAARLGVAYGFQSVRRLIALIGPAHASMLLFSGSRIGSEEAARIGLVNQVVANEELEEVVDVLARNIAENAPLSVRASKLTIEQALRDPADRDMHALEQASIACFNSEDYREGRTAFLEKRPPKFRGR